MQTEAKITSDFGPIKALAYSITRDMAPIYVLRPTHQKAYNRPKRGIAGSLIFREIYDYIEHPNWLFDIEVTTDEETIYFYGVELLDEGWPVEEISPDEQITFIATGMTVQSRKAGEEFVRTFIDNG